MPGKETTSYRRGLGDGASSSGIRIRNIRERNNPNIHARRSPPARGGCECCLRVFEASTAALEAYRSFLCNAKSQFLNEAVRHAGEEDLWIRTLTRLGVPEGEYSGRVPQTGFTKELAERGRACT